MLVLWSYVLLQYGVLISNNICIYVNVLLTGAVLLEFSLIRIRKRWNFVFTL